MSQLLKIMRDKLCLALLLISPLGALMTHYTHPISPLSDPLRAIFHQICVLQFSQKIIAKLSPIEEFLIGQQGLAALAAFVKISNLPTIYQN